jgi:hypothetical protein
MIHRFLSYILVALFLSSGLPFAAAAEILHVSGPQDLAQAMKAPSAGLVIELAPGDYGTLSLRGGTANTPVTLRSSDPAKPARFSSMLLREMAGLTIENVVFDYDFAPGDNIALRPFQIITSQKITIRGCIFDGDIAQGRSAIDDGYPTGIGFSVRDSSDIVLEQSEIRKFFRGLAIRASKNVILRGNNLHSIRMDGMNFAEVQAVRIENNHIHDFIRNLDSKDHSDMIQFWTGKTSAPSRDIVIRNNLLSSGDGWFTQSIFMRNEIVDTGKAGQGMFYQNLTIEENVIFNAQAHGITVGETNGLTVRNNSLIRNARSSGTRQNVVIYQPRISIAPASHDVTIQANVTNSIKGYTAQPDWHVADNVLVQDQSVSKIGYYGSVFTSTTGDTADELRNFYAKSGGAIDKARAGAAVLRP